VPLDPAISSNFCEYRDGRFHAGIDVRTFGQEGVPCLAVADGSIVRIRAGSRGYGRALHLRLASGEELVYAHLSEFAPALEDTLRAAQARDTTYTVDLRVAAGRFRVAAGDTIAFSGSTGTLAPHLHLEVRDADERPMNPFVHGFPLADRLRPAINRVVFVPLEPGARVNGRATPLGLTPRRVGEGRFAISDTLRLAGRVGVAASVLDRVNAESGRLAPYAVEAWAGDSLLTRLVLERFSFDRSAEVDLLYHAGSLRGRGTSVFQLYPVADAGLHEFVRDGGALPAAGAEAQSGRVRALDAAGNSAEVLFYYRENGGPAPTPKAGRSDLTVELGGAYFQDGFAVFPASAAARAGAGPAGDPAGVIVVEARHLGDVARPLAAYADPDTATVWVAGLRAGEDRHLEFPGHGLSLDIPARAAGADMVVYARGDDTIAKGMDGVVRRTRPVRLGPVGWVLRGEVTVRVRTDAPGDRDALYRFDDYRRSWSYLPSERDSTGEVRAKAGRPGVFAVFRDEVPPRLGQPVVSYSHSWATGDTLLEIHIPVDDAGSGFDEAASVVRVGGVRRVFRWDFAGKKIIVPLRGEPIIGPQSIRAVVFDRIGNRSAIDATVYPGAP